MNPKVTDVVIVGAGPYGLSLAAYLRPTSLSCRIFGTPMQSWREQMPRGMFLKSEGFASTLYDPGSQYTLRDFCRERLLPYADIGLPVPVETFAAYGVAFQERMVPQLEQTNIVSIALSAGGFTVETAAGEFFEAKKVIMAVGIAPFPYLPPALSGLPVEYVTHSSEHHDLEEFSGRSVAVVGSGASAVDMAALLHRAGAQVHLVARREKLAFHEQGKEPRTLLEQIRKPRSGLGVSWRSRMCSDIPLVFHAMPKALRLRVVDRHLGPAPGWFVRDQVVGRFPLHMGCNVEQITIEDHKALLHMSRTNGDESVLAVDHVIAGTGFRVSISTLRMLAEPMRSAIRTLADTPILSRNFESSTAGLYFVGLASANSFGPLTRFACGAEFTAKHLSTHLIAAKAS